MPKDMSWLSPKRRRTTGAVPTVQNSAPTVNGHSDGGGSEPESPTVGIGRRAPTTPKSEPRPFPTPTSSMSSTNGFGGGMTAGSGDGNLFYAYARKADDLRSRYLLTFASAATANEWWNLLHSNFPDTTRPGAQLFSFKSDDLLSKAWKHPSFAHLKSKWMYIQFNDASNVGGAAQGIIPLQDASGNLLGGSAGGSPEQLGQMRREARSVKNELGVLEQHFERMMEAVERNSEQIAQLAEERKESEARHAREVSEERSGSGAGGRGEGYYDMSELSGHLGRITDLLERNSTHVEALAKRQHDSEAKLREALEDNRAQKRADYLDMSQLSAHLDRIQGLMERNTHERKDSAKDVGTSAPALDFSPLTDRLEKVLGAVEQNSHLVGKLLDRSDAEKEGSNTRLEKKLDELIQAQKESSRIMPKEPLELDVSPLAQRLDDMLDAQEAASARQQSAGEKVTGTLERMLDTQHKAMERGPFDVSLLSQRLDEILSVHRNAATEPLVAKIDELIQTHKKATATQPLNLAPMTSRLDDLIAEVATSRDAMDFSPLVEQLKNISTSSEESSQQIASLVETQRANPPSSLDLSPVANQLQALRTTTAKTNTHLTNLLKSQSDDRQALITRSKDPTPPSDITTAIDFSPLTDRLARIHDTLETQHSRAQSPGTGDAKFLISALTSHLSRIQAVTENNALAVKSLASRTSGSHDKIWTALTETSEQIRTLARKGGALESQAGVREGQFRDLVRSQGEVVESLRLLAGAIKEDKQCGHVVVPPPRKTGRKVVGFVYEQGNGGRS